MNETKSRMIRLAKDLVFVALALFIMVRGRIFGFILGLLFVYWYGRDAMFQLKAIRQEKNYREPQGTGGTTRPERPTTQAPPEDKIQATNLSDAKEVEFEKE